MGVVFQKGVVLSPDEVLRFLHSIEGYTRPCNIYLTARNESVRSFPELGIERRVDPYVEIFPELKS